MAVDHGPDEVPRYPVAEAARYLHLPVATLRSWVLGRPYRTKTGQRRFEPLIALPGTNGRLSYSNLIEAHVLRSLRLEHEVRVQEVRKAIAVAARRHGIQRLLRSPELRAGAGKLFLDTYSELIELTASGQVAMRAVFEKHLSRIEWDRVGPLRLYPFSSMADGGLRRISISPGVSSGRPVIHRRGIRTAVVVERLDAGESAAEVAADYDLELDEVIAAATYERAA